MTTKTRALSLLLLATALLGSILTLRTRVELGRAATERISHGNLIWNQAQFEEEVFAAGEDYRFEDTRRYLRYTTEGYGCSGDCDFNAIFNITQIAGLKLWAKKTDSKTGEVYHLPCGGEAMCHEPYLTENVSCYVEETDCNFGGTHYRDPTVLKTYLLDCRGDRVCGEEAPEACCIITKTIKGKVLNLTDES